MPLQCLDFKFSHSPYLAIVALRVPAVLVEASQLGLRSGGDLMPWNFQKCRGMDPASICLGGNRCVGSNTGTLCEQCQPGYTNQRSIVFGAGKGALAELLTCLTAFALRKGLHEFVFLPSASCRKSVKLAGLVSFAGSLVNSQSA